MRSLWIGFLLTLFHTQNLYPDLGNSNGAMQADWTRFTGWYQLEEGREGLLSWAADGGLRMFGIEKPYFSQPFEPQDDGSFLWSVKGENEPRLVRFNFDDSDRVRGFEWKAPMGLAGYADRHLDQPYSLRELVYWNHDVQLSGTLLQPEADQPVSAAVMIHGSGDSDRNNLWYLGIAHHLARSGIAVLLPDKRGCGLSGGDWKISSMDDFAGDALNAVRAVQSLEGINAGKTGLLGISQGGRIAPLAAVRETSIAFVINVSGGTLPVNQSLLHESRQTLRQNGMPGWMADGFGPFAAAIAQLRHPVWWKKNGKFDPMPYWRQLSVPALVVYGADDEHDNVPVYRSIELLQEAKGTGDLTIQVFPDSGHGLFLPKTQTIRPEFLDLLSSWITEKTRFT